MTMRLLWHDQPQPCFHPKTGVSSVRVHLPRGQRYLQIDLYGGQADVMGVRCKCPRLRVLAKSLSFVMSLLHILEIQLENTHIINIENNIHNPWHIIGIRIRLRKAI